MPFHVSISVPDTLECGIFSAVATPRHNTLGQGMSSLSTCGIALTELTRRMKLAGRGSEYSFHVFTKHSMRFVEWRGGREGGWVGGGELMMLMP